MKKLCFSFGVLCLACLLFCGTAMAAGPEVAAEYAGTITVQETQKGTDRAYTVSRTSGAEAGQLYLALLLKGKDDATTNTAPLPTVENVYYMDVKAAEGASVAFDVYPKAMEDGTYIVYLSDYNNAGAAKGVAKIVIGGGGGTAILYGDVTGDGQVKGNDAIFLTRYLAKWTGYGPGEKNNIVLENADIDDNGSVKGNDAIFLTRYLAKWTGYETLPHK